MAEIRIEKKRTGVWMWIVALIVILLLGWLVYELFFSQTGTTIPGAVLLLQGGG